MSFSVTALTKRILPMCWSRVLQRKYFECAHLRFTLTSGIRVQVLSQVDWCLYNDIFVNGEYDRPIHLLTSYARSGREELRILDLGSNVGFFLLRVLDLLAVEGYQGLLSFGAVEPDACNVAELNRRLGEQDACHTERCRLHLVRGLVGKRQGAAAFRQSHGHHAGRVVESFADGSSTTVDLDYVDLDRTFGGGPWDLVKCDIEGSEGQFVENYPHLLGKTGVLVIEVHHGDCDPAEIAARLLAYGLHHQGCIAERQDNSVHFFRRQHV